MQAVLFDTDAGIARITLNRPEALNAFDPAMFDELNAAIDRFRGDPALKVAVVSGAGKRAFSAGVDLKNLSGALGEGALRDSEYEIRFAEPGYLDKPIIAAIRGWCVGEGVHVALACDMRVCASDAVFSVPEVAVGMPLIRLSSQCVRAIGLPAAIDLCFLGEKKDAAWALKHQLVHRVVLPGEELEAALQIAASLCRMSMPALRLTKQTMYKALDLAYREVYEFGLPLRKEIFSSGEVRRAIGSFVSRSRPGEQAPHPNALGAKR